jgi:mannose-6-phosphate isomerase-like protein (cupin superfamily)
MLLKENQINSIKDKKITSVKNFINNTKIYDFNLLSNLLEENKVESIITGDSKMGRILESIFQIKGIKLLFNEFNIVFDFLLKTFRYPYHPHDDVDLFFSFVTQIGPPHIDEEDVFIIGLKGTTIYRIYDKEITDHTIEEGDLIFIPRGLKHKVIGMTPRIIASIGYHG